MQNHTSDFIFYCEGGVHFRNRIIKIWSIFLRAAHIHNFYIKYKIK